MGYKVTDVGASVANKLVLDEELDAANPAAEQTADDESANDARYRMDGLDGDDPGHDFGSPPSKLGRFLLDYGIDQSMDGGSGSVNKAGYAVVGPVRSDELDESKKREREADDLLHLMLEQYEAARRLAELDARIAELTKKIDELDKKINAFDKAFDLGNDADINDNTLNAYAKREQLRQAIQDAGLDPNAYFKADGSFDQEKWQRDEQENRLRMRDAQRQRDQYIDQLIRAQRDRDALLKSNPELRNQIKGASAGDPAALEETRRLDSSVQGSQSLKYTVLQNSPDLSVAQKAEVLQQTGRLSAESATVLAHNTDASSGWDAAANLSGISTVAPTEAPQLANSRLPETPAELLAPVNSLLPADMKIPAPNIKLFDLIPQGVLTGASAPATPRATGSFAAELGMGDATGGIKPISGTFARATNGEIPAEAVASADSALAATAAEKDRVASYSTGTSGAGMKV